jgi:hypothetical protein
MRLQRLLGPVIRMFSYVCVRWQVFNAQLLGYLFRSCAR